MWHACIVQLIEAAARPGSLPIHLSAWHTAWPTAPRPPRLPPLPPPPALQLWRHAWWQQHKAWQRRCSQTVLHHWMPRCWRWSRAPSPPAAQRYSCWHACWLYCCLTGCHMYWCLAVRLLGEPRLASPQPLHPSAPVHLLLLPPGLQGLRLYWRCLESLVAAEEARPGGTPGAAGSLLSAPVFHRCVAACAFECVVSAYRMVSQTLAATSQRRQCGQLLAFPATAPACLPVPRASPAQPPIHSPCSLAPPAHLPALQGNLPFPAVQERLKLPAFELCKVLEAFVQQLPTLPRCVPGWLLYRCRA